MDKIDLKAFRFEGSVLGEIPDLRQLDPADKAEMLMSGVDVEERDRAGTYIQVDHGRVHCQSRQPGVEILDIKDALAKYDGLPGHFWTQVDPDKDEFTKAAATNLHGGYFVRTAKGAKITEPVQSCLFLKGDMSVSSARGKPLRSDSGRDVRLQGKSTLDSAWQQW